MRRYLLIRIYSENLTAISGEQFIDALMSSVRKYFGEIGVSTIDPKLLRFDPHRSEAIVACQKKSRERIASSCCTHQRNCWIVNSSIDRKNFWYNQELGDLITMFLMQQ